MHAYISVFELADLKMSLTAETKNWMVDYGLYCNRKYRSEMEQIFAFVDEAGKKLNRQIKDLDDIRIAMAALKEIREQQISIDFQVGPIEVKPSIMSLHLRPFVYTQKCCGRIGTSFSSIELLTILEVS